MYRSLAAVAILVVSAIAGMGPAQCQSPSVPTHSRPADKAPDDGRAPDEGTPTSINPLAVPQWMTKAVGHMLSGDADNDGDKDFIQPRR